jgi:hypothetical protein
VTVFRRRTLSRFVRDELTAVDVAGTTPDERPPAAGVAGDAKRAT